MRNHYASEEGLTMKNREVKFAIKKAGLTVKEVAAEMCLHASHFSRVLNSDISKSRKQDIFDAISRLKECKPEGYCTEKEG